jgi:hypothetical protein
MTYADYPDTAKYNAIQKDKVKKHGKSKYRYFRGNFGIG